MNKSDEEKEKEWQNNRCKHIGATYTDMNKVKRCSLCDLPYDDNTLTGWQK